MSEITCLACSHRAKVEAGPPFTESIFVCNECGARMVYGELAPRVVVEPRTDPLGRAWVRVRFQDARTQRDMYTADLDPQHAAMLAKAQLSLVIP